MSLPISAAMRVSFPSGRCVWKISSRASSVVAASELPPPSPAPCGVSFFRKMRTCGAICVASKNPRAARTTRFVPSAGSVVSLHVKAIPPLLLRSISNVSRIAIGDMSVAISWKPSSRRRTMRSERLIFAGAKNCITDLRVRGA